MKGLMDQAKQPQEAPAEDERTIDSDLLYESAIAFLSEPEGTKALMQSIGGAKDVGTAIGKMAAMVIMRIMEESASAEMPINEESIFGQDGGLTKVLTAIYVIANKNGAKLPMEQSLIQAYTVAEQDIEAILAQKGSGAQQQQGAPMPPNGGLMGAAQAPQPAPSGAF